jgi:hypothetical protein
MDCPELIKAIKAGECPKLLANSSLMFSHKSEPVEVWEGTMTIGSDDHPDYFRFGVGSYFVMSSDFYVCTALSEMESGEFLIGFTQVCSALDLVLELTE